MRPESWEKVVVYGLARFIVYLLDSCHKNSFMAPHLCKNPVMVSPVMKL